MSKDLAKLRAQIDALDERPAAPAQRARPARACASASSSRATRSTGPSAKPRCCAGCSKRTPVRCGKEALARVYPRDHVRLPRAGAAARGRLSRPRRHLQRDGGARSMFGGGVRAQPCASIDEVFRAVETGSANYGVVPVENSTEGAIGRTLDLLLSTPLKICGETVLRVHQNLMSKSRFAQENRARLFACAIAGAVPPVAEPQPARRRAHSRGEQCRGGAPGRAGRRLLRPSPAISPSQRYGLKLLARNIEDDPNNTTRFLVLGDHDAAPSGKDQTSLVMSAPNRPGAVHALLTPIAEARRQHEPARIAPGAHRALGIRVLRRCRGPSPGSQGGQGAGRAGKARAAS